MIKKLELTDPKSCMSKAEEGEMLFVLLGRDITAPATIRYWCQLRVFEGKNQRDDPQIVEALACAYQMDVDRKMATPPIVLEYLQDITDGGGGGSREEGRGGG